MKKRWKEDTPKQMIELRDLLGSLNDFSASNQEAGVKSWIGERNYKLGDVMNAFRLAIVGESKGPHMFDITEVIGKEETIERLNRAVENIGK